MSYYRDIYLQSDEWKQLKAKKEAKTKKRCSICGRYGNKELVIDLHHLFYRSNLSDTQTSDLRWTCRRCHDLAHELIASGVIKFKPNASHHSMFAVTKHRVLKEIENRSGHKTGVDYNHPMAKRIDSLRNGTAGWSKKALTELGVAWPPKKGWRKQLILDAMAHSK